MGLITVLTERSSARYQASLKDPVGEPVTNFTAVTLTFYDPVRDEIVNGRDNQNIMGVNNGTIDVNGLLTWLMQPADLVILDDTRQHEPRIALFHFTWGAANEHFHELAFSVRNVRTVVAA